MLGAVLGFAVIFFPLSEIIMAVAKRGSGSAKVDDRGSMRLLWGVIMVCVAIAGVIATYRVTSFAFPMWIQQLAATVLLIGGLVLRWSAIFALGRFFTTNVATHDDHTVVNTGPYRYVRHPSYTGLLLAFVGIGVFFGSWLSLAVIVIPITLAVIHRIRIEETVLVGGLGAAYTEYCACTKRLIPGVW